MGVAYSQDLRDRVLVAVDGGLGVYSAAPLLAEIIAVIRRGKRPLRRGSACKIAP